MSPKQFVLALLLLVSLKSAHATIYQITDRSDKFPGGNKYAKELNSNYTTRVLFGARRTILNTFNQKDGEGKKYNRVTLLIDSFAQNGIGQYPQAVASTKGNLIWLNADYLQRYQGDIKEEFAGVVYHEMTHVWQWTGNRRAPRGLINGIADYVRLKGGYASKGWPRKGSGSRWDDGYAVTAYFLDYCNDLKHGFVAELNALMKDSYSEAFFIQLLGKSVPELWRDYKLAYSTKRIPVREESYRKPLTDASYYANYIPLKTEDVPKNNADLHPWENNNDYLRAESTGVTIDSSKSQRNDFAESAKDSIKDLGNCNGVWGSLLGKVSAMIKKITAPIPYINSRKLDMNWRLKEVGRLN